MSAPKRQYLNLLPWIPLLATLGLFPQVNTTLRIDLLRFTSRLLRGVNEFQASEAFTPRGGEGILPAEVRPLIARLRESGVRDCSIDRTLKLPSEAYQRLVEGAYPIRFVEGACCRIAPSPTSQLADVRTDGCP